jgi:beta-N-acetylhexosaminidase
VRRSQLWTRIGGGVIAVAVVVTLGTNAAAGRFPFGPASGPAAGRTAHAAAGVIAAAPAADAVGAVSAPGAAGAKTGTRAATAADAVTAAASSADAAAAAALPALDRQQLAGQRVIYSYKGHTPPAGLLWLIRHGEVAGVIFFGGNISSEAQIRGVIRQLDAANAAKTNPVRAPLLLMTDQEGGLVRRLPGAPALSEKQIGASAHPGTQAAGAGTGAGKNLRGVGMNVNLAPVLDVYRKAGDFIDEFQRSYSTSASVVATLGPDFIKAQQGQKVAATAKHFPGLGAATTSQNTDERPVTINHSLNTLRTVDEKPYGPAIAAGVKLIMVSWAIYPVFDKKRPAGLAYAVATSELRGRLGFKGVTITDALEAGALKAFGSTANRAVSAAGAGMDLLLASGQNTAQGSQARSAVAAAYQSGRLGHPPFLAAVQRVLALRMSLR